MRLIAFIILAVATAFSSLAAAQEPPGRVGRIAYAEGDVAIYQDPEIAWEKAYVNSPLTSENSVWTEPRSRAEVRVSGIALRMAGGTQLDIPRLDDEAVSAFLVRGSVALRVRWFDDNQLLDIGTPQGDVRFYGVGRFRLDVDPDRDSTLLTVFAGTAALRSGDVPGAVRHLRAAVDAEVALSGYWDDFHIYWPIAFRSALEVEDAEAVAALWAHHEEAGQAGPSSNLCGHTKVFEALLELREVQPDRGRAERLLRDGIEILDGCGVVVWRAHAQEDLGGLLFEQGRIEDAEPLLEAARETYADLGASAWLARLDALTRVG